jgi:hypothetical protein
VNTFNSFYVKMVKYFELTLKLFNKTWVLYTL